MKKKATRLLYIACIPFCIAIILISVGLVLVRQEEFERLFALVGLYALSGIIFLVILGRLRPHLTEEEEPQRKEN